jgi:ABC-type transport system involved in cytochrome c biogenesis permease subunit
MIVEDKVLSRQRRDLARDAPIGRVARARRGRYLHLGRGLGYLVRRRTPGRLAWAPAPERLDLYGHQFLLIAFLCLGVMIVARSLWAHQSWGRYWAWAWDPIETAALAAWIVYGIILHFRVLYRWSGTRMAWLNVGAFGVAVLTVYIVVMVLPTIHNFYMVGPG